MFRDTASFDLQITALSQAEAMVHPARNGKLDKFQKLVSGLGMEVTPIEGSDASKLATLRATTSLKMPDVCVLHQAMKVKGAIATTDKELAKAAKSKGVGVFAPLG
jgi:rRNA-processing protein FCF1